MFSEKKRFPWGWIAITVVLGAIGILFIIAAFEDDAFRREPGASRRADKPP